MGRKYTVRSRTPTEWRQAIEEHVPRKARRKIAILVYWEVSESKAWIADDPAKKWFKQHSLDYDSDPWSSELLLRTIRKHMLAIGFSENIVQLRFREKMTQKEYKKKNNPCRKGNQPNRKDSHG
jgi:hypothetical protein